ncbi:MAG: hypothetical protein ABFD25_16495, partial [Clostridiaceae bacterium]
THTTPPMIYCLAIVSRLQLYHRSLCSELKPFYPPAELVVVYATRNGPAYRKQSHSISAIGQDT